MTESVKVFVRFRPLLEREDAKAPSLWTFDDHTVTGMDHSYTFDGVFPVESAQSSVYEKIGQPLVHQVLDGFNACVCCFGATSSGKTHTMLGEIDSAEQKGMIPRLVEELVLQCHNTDPDLEHKLEMSYVEIYQERIRDLLDSDPTKVLKIRETEFPHSVYIENTRTVAVTTSDEVLTLLREGNEHRAVAETQMNAHSSRSHAVFIMHLTKTDKRMQKRKLSRLFLVDLAGSEQVDRSGATGQALDEAKKINQSLSCLARVIHALTSDRSHVPYRDSKLTRLLSDTLGGNSKTVLLLACSSAEDSARETTNTLQFGQRAKLIKNTPKMNEEVSIKGYQMLVSQLEARLKHFEGLAGLETTIDQQSQALEDRKREIQSLRDLLISHEEVSASLQEELAQLSAFDDTYFFQLDRVFRVCPEKL